jgi:toxin HigB-1
MIQSFANKQTQAFAAGDFVREFSGFQDQAAKRLAILNAATSLGDLRALPVTA